MCMGVNQRNLKLLHMAEVPFHQIVGHLIDFLKTNLKSESILEWLHYELKEPVRVDLTRKIMRKLKRIAAIISVLRAFMQFCGNFLVKSARSFLDFFHLTIFFLRNHFPNLSPTLFKRKRKWQIWVS